MPHVTIIGGGITGLATAFYLEKESKAHNLPFSYTLLEGSARFGGKVVTETSPDQFVIEGGPDSFISQKPWGTQLCHDLGLADHIVPTNDDRRNVFILHRGRLVPFPGGFRLTVPTEFWPFVRTPLISPWGKVRMALERLLPPRTGAEDESLAAFFGRRLGREAVEKIAGPLMAGIYMADPDQLSIQSTFSTFVDRERRYGSLIKGMRQAARPRSAPANASTPPRAMFHTLKGGMGELIEALVAHLEGDLRLNCRVKEIHYLSPGFEISLDAAGQAPLKTDAVVLAVPAYVAAGLVEAIAPELAGRLSGIRYVSSATISLGYRRSDAATQHDFNGFGFVVPKTENRNIVACTWTSTKFDHRAPPDKILLRAFVGGHRQEHLVDLPDEALIGLVQEELAAIMGLTASPTHCKIFRWPQGNPQYHVGHQSRVAAIEDSAMRLPQLYLAGSAYYGIGLPDCIKSGLNTVERIVREIR